MTKKFVLTILTFQFLFITEFHNDRTKFIMIKTKFEFYLLLIIVLIAFEIKMFINTNLIQI